MVIFNRYKIVTAGFEKASKKLIHTGLREIGSFTSLSAERQSQEQPKQRQVPQIQYLWDFFFVYMSRGKAKKKPFLDIVA